MGALTFAQALLQAEAQARSTLDAALHERVSAGVALVHDGKVFQTTDGTWQVSSSRQEGRVYSPNGTCSCDDVHFNRQPQNLCKHRLAVYLTRRTMKLMQADPLPVDPEILEPFPENDDEPEEPAAPVLCPEPLPEAPCSLNVHLVIDGVPVQITLRGHEELAVLVRLRAMLTAYPQPQPVPQAASQGQGEGWCAVHQVQMKLNNKNGNQWFSHRLATGDYCKGK